MPGKQRTLIWNIVVLLLFLIGNVLTILSLAAEILGLDITPGFGMVQMFQLLVGLTFLSLAGFIHIYSLRDPDTPRSLQADIGIRLAATGLVFAYVAGLSDLLGIGTHVEPDFERPYVGPLQLGGLILGILSITVGMILYHTSRGSQHTSSLGFLLEDPEQTHSDGETNQADATERVPGRSDGERTIEDDRQGHFAGSGSADAA